jgi:hypothetical protein
MTKQDYINQRVNNLIDTRLAWEMYVSVLKGMPWITRETFNQAFPIYINILHGDITGYWSYYDQLFKVDKLIKKDGNVIYC